MSEPSVAVHRTSPTADLSGQYTIDAANSRLGFAARYAMVSTVHGHFARFSGDATIDDDDPPVSTVSVRIDAASLDTGQAQRDEHLRSPDFLDVASYPQIVFESASVIALGVGRYRLDGSLSICAAVRPVSIELCLTGTSIDHRGYRLIGFTGSTAISRGEFGLTWNAALETGGLLVGDHVELSFDLALIRASSRPAAASVKRWRSVLGLSR